MQELTIYLTFDGNCREALSFYAKCLGADLHVMPFSEGKGHCDVPAGMQDKVMHSSLTKGGHAILMASDNFPGMPLQKGNNFTISINCDSAENADKLFSALGENGKVIMPMKDMFWGAYWGQLTDQFGITWMFNAERQKA
jgi:PhnB protein